MTYLVWTPDCPIVALKNMILATPGGKKNFGNRKRDTLRLNEKDLLEIGITKI